MVATVNPSDHQIEFFERRLKKDHSPILSRVVTWCNIVENHRFNKGVILRHGNPENESVSFADEGITQFLIHKGHYILNEIRDNKVDLSPIGLSIEAIESEIDALKFQLEIDHGDLMPQEDSDRILKSFFNA